MQESTPFFGPKVDPYKSPGSKGVGGGGEQMIRYRGKGKLERKKKKKVTKENRKRATIRRRGIGNE